MYLRLLGSACALSLFAVHLSCFAIDSESDVRAFVRANAGKFASEVEGLPKRFVVRFRSDDSAWKGVNYDPSKEALTYPFGIEVSDAQIYRRCKTTGTYIGQNAYGAKRTISRRSCEQLRVIDSDVSSPRLLIGERDSYRQTYLEITMSPSTYRLVKAQGVLYELEMQVDEDAPRSVADREQVVITATFTDPYQDRVDHHDLNARFLSLKVLTADGKQILMTYVR